MKPLVSIIVPTYNDEKYISETINSILSQTYKNFEIIVVDDCSTDKTVVILDSFNDPRIRIFKNSSNMGTAYSRNLAIRESKGEYIAFLDGDDLWDVNKLEHQLDFMEKNGYVFSYTNFVTFSEEHNKRYVISGPKKVTHKDFIRTAYVGCLTVMYKKSVCPDLQIPSNIRKRNDYALWLLLSKNCDCYLLNENLSYYRLRSGGISRVKKSKLFKYHILVFKEGMHFSSFKAFLCAARNVLYFYLRRIFYKKRLRNGK